jgi:hypothetical protein
VRLLQVALLGLMIGVTPALASPPEGAAGLGQAPSPPLDGTAQSDFVWGTSGDRVEELWRRSKEAAERWWDDSQQGAEDIWQRSRDKARAAWQETRRYLQPAAEDHFARVWDGVLPTLEETLALEERQATLPESSWFGEDQASNQAAIDELLDQAVDLLSTSDVQSYRDRIASLQQEIGRARQDIAEYRRLRVSAPRESLVNKTVSDYAQAIAAREADIDGFEDELSRAKAEFAAELRGLGLELSDEQVELLLSTVVGDNLIDLGIVFDNVKSITEQLERLVAESGEDLPSARRYYGMYVVLLKSLHQMHLQVEQAIAGKYIPQIEAIAERARDLSEQTRGLMARTPAKREILEANLEAQRLTVEAAGIYRDYLDAQGREVTAARVALEKDIAAAWNTYETVRVSGELVGLVRSSRELLEGLLDRQVPALRPFRNQEMQREFEKLTAQLRAERG